MNSFAHLHVHSEHSLLDGLSSAKDLVETAYAQGQPAVAVTDHGSLGMTLKLTLAAEKLCDELVKAGEWEADAPLPVKPIMGEEVYLAIGSREDKGFKAVSSDDLVVEDSDGKAVAGVKQKRYEHLTLLCESEEGWRNLLRLHRKSFDSFWYKPRMDFDLLAEHSGGLIALTGCLGGPVAGRLKEGDEAGARDALDRLVEIFGEDNVFVEIMDHGVEGEPAVMVRLMELAAEYGLPLVSTNDCHYTRADQADAHDAWITLQSGKYTTARLDDPKRFRFHGAGYHLRSTEEMYDHLADMDEGVFAAAFGADTDRDWVLDNWRTACENTAVIAERIPDRVIPQPARHLPKFPVPDDFEVPAARRGRTKHPIRDGAPVLDEDVPLTPADEYLFEKVWEGAKWRYGTPVPAEVKERLRTEFDIIVGLGFADYYLIVDEIIRWSRARGIAVGPGRGSGAGSLCAYCLDITRVEPLKYHLLFERFLEPGRTNYPDFDVDFEKRRRDEVINHLREKWGADKIAKIGTYQPELSKGALHAASRLLDRPDFMDLTKKVPVSGGKPATFAELADTDSHVGDDLRAALAELDEDDQEAFNEVLALATPMEGTTAREGIHACGHIISDVPLEDMIPMRLDTRAKAGTDRAGYPVSEWEGPELEDMGFLKMDVLGLRTLDIIQAACETVSAQTGQTITMESIPDPDTKGDEKVDAAYALISSGRTAGVFQLDGGGMQKVCRDVRPDGLRDLSAVVALYRPGPIQAQMPELYADRKWGRKEVDYTKYTDDEAEQDAIDSILGETQGCLVYQEELMRLGTVVAGFDAKWRSKLRKAVGKKKPELMAQVGTKFMADAVVEMELPDGTVKPPFAESTAANLWEDFKGNAEYSFNASHSYAYGVLTFITAYLKANWPAAFGAADLSLTSTDEKRLKALQSLQAEGVKVSAPDINRSTARTHPVSATEIALGLSEVKGVGAAGDEIVKEREENGPFTSLADLVGRLPALSTLVLTALIEAGACDAFGPRRGQLMVARAVKKVPGAVIDTTEWHPVERARRQRDRLGLVISSDHPMSLLPAELNAWIAEAGWGGEKRKALAKVADLTEASSVVTYGVLQHWDQRISKAGNPYARFAIENATTTIDGIAFSRTIDELDGPLAAGDVVRVSGVVQYAQQRERPAGDDADGDGLEDDAVVEQTPEIKAYEFAKVELDETPVPFTSGAQVSHLLAAYFPRDEDYEEAGESNPGPVAVDSPEDGEIPYRETPPVDVGAESDTSAPVAGPRPGGGTAVAEAPTIEAAPPKAPTPAANRQPESPTRAITAPGIHDARARACTEMDRVRGTAVILSGIDDAYWYTDGVRQAGGRHSLTASIGVTMLVNGCPPGIYRAAQPKEPTVAVVVASGDWEFPADALEKLADATGRVDVTACEPVAVYPASGLSDTTLERLA